MAKEWAKKFYNSNKWIKCRESYIAERISIDGGMCEECGQELGYIVHHTITLTPDNINDPNITFNHKYLKYDCKRCHDREDGHFISCKRNEEEVRYRFDRNGQLLPP